MKDQKPSPLNRALQRDLLLLLRDEYPRTLIEIPEISDVSEQSIFMNLWYLQEHGLCESGLSQVADGRFIWSGTLTAKGLDFLEDDGGLTAILGAITIKIHTDTLREMLNARIDAAQISPEEKSALKQKLRHFSETVLKAAPTDLVKTGLDHIPNVVEWLRKLSGL